MSELQNEFTELDNTTNVENVEQPQEVAAELAPASEAEHEQQPQAVEDQEAKQKAINDAINKKHFEAKQAERRAEEAERQLKEYQRQEQERMSAKFAEVPPVPDAFDDDYEVKIAERDKALAAKAQFDAEQNWIQKQQLEQQQKAEAQSQAEFAEKAKKYAQRATELGIKQDELGAAANVVAQLGLSDELVRFIIADSDGPLIVKHLAANQAEGIELAQTSPFLVGQKLDTIKTNASALKPKQSTAPAPSIDVGGKGVDNDTGRYLNIKGAKFE